MQRRQDKSQPRPDAMLLLLREPSCGLGADLRGKLLTGEFSPPQAPALARLRPWSRGESRAEGGENNAATVGIFFQLSLSTLTNGLDLVTLVSS